MNYINVVETRTRIGQIIEDVHYNHKKYVITRRGRPYAKIVPIKSTSKVQKSNTSNLSMLARDAQKLQTKSINLQKVMNDIRK